MTLWRSKGVGKRDTNHLVAPALKPRLFRQLFEAALPRIVSGSQNCTYDVTWDAHLLAMARQQVLKLKARVIDSIARVQFNLSYGPVPDRGQGREPIL